MGMYLCRHESDYTLAVWRCDESLDELSSSIQFPQPLLEEAAAFKAPHRRLEWLSVRALFFSMTGLFIPIYYEPSGKPRIDNGFISISHTKGYVAVAYSKHREVAVDIEQYADRVVRVAPRFMNAAEQPSTYDDEKIWSLLLHWSAKETVYKMVGESTVDFSNSIVVRPFDVEPSGSLTADAKKEENLWIPLSVNYLLNKEFVLTWI
jgi:phosphopantetheinyl transferase